jgi:hypothetical protein
LFGRIFKGANRYPLCWKMLQWGGQTAQHKAAFGDER